MASARLTIGSFTCAVSSAHTKHRLEDLHPNIAVFRHPDHIPDDHELAQSFQNLALDTAGIAKMPRHSLEDLYGVSEDMILYWSHHEKLCLIDGTIAFMGGLDMCYGRWDTHQHFTVDVHPADPRETVYPGQDYNNARVADFQNVAHWENNELDRRSTPRMGWSDVSVSLRGVVVEDLRRHFVERWNFIYATKYERRDNPRYSKLALYGRPPGSHHSSHGPPAGQGHSPRPSHDRPPHPPPRPYSPRYEQSPPPSYGQSQQQQQSYNYPPHEYGPPSEQYGQPQQPYEPYRPSGYQQPYSQYPASSHSQTPPPGGYNYPGQSYSPQPPSSISPSQTPQFTPPPGQEHGYARGIGPQGEQDSERGFNKDKLSSYESKLRGELAGQIHLYQDRFTSQLGNYGYQGQGQRPPMNPRGNMTCQVVRSCSKWSNGVQTEHSVADTYASIIRYSRHFVYIENQFFITATSNAQKPVQNKIGVAIVDRILRAAREGQKYKIIVVIPSVPAFAGDLKSDSTLGTRAIMEFQYNSINRGGHSIMEIIANEGYNPMEYIRFYNLRTYDRINLGPVFAGHPPGPGYPAPGYDPRTYGPPPPSPPGPYRRPAFDTTSPYQPSPYQMHGARSGDGGSVSSSNSGKMTASGPGRWDSVSECYMLGGEDIRNVPWEGPAEAEIDAFVSEELYVHTKVREKKRERCMDYYFLILIECGLGVDRG